MTELLENAIREAQALPPEAQDALAQVMPSYVGDADTVIELTPEEEEADLIEAQAEMARGEFATDAKVEAISPSTACEAALLEARLSADRRPPRLSRTTIALASRTVSDRQ